MNKFLASLAFALLVCTTSFAQQSVIYIQGHGA